MSGQITLENIDIVIKESERPELLKDMNGVGGYCPSGHFVQLDIDINHPVFQKSPQQVVEQSLAHELHHATRRQAGVPIFGGSFLECMFSEGLADYFAYELTGDLSVWIITLSGRNKDKLMKRARNKFKKTITYKDYDDWFTVGSKKLKIPRRAGYTLSFDLVKNYLENNPQESAASLVSVSVEKIKINQKI